MRCREEQRRCAAGVVLSGRGLLVRVGPRKIPVCSTLPHRSRKSHAPRWVGAPPPPPPAAALLLLQIKSGINSQHANEELLEHLRGVLSEWAVGVWWVVGWG